MNWTSSLLKNRVLLRFFNSWWCDSVTDDKTSQDHGNIEAPLPRNPLYQRDPAGITMPRRKLRKPVFKLQAVACTQVRFKTNLPKTLWRQDNLAQTYFGIKTKLITWHKKSSLFLPRCFLQAQKLIMRSSKMPKTYRSTLCRCSVTIEYKDGCLISRSSLCKCTKTLEKHTIATARADRNCQHELMRSLQFLSKASPTRPNYMSTLICDCTGGFILA